MRSRSVRRHAGLRAAPAALAVILGGLALVPAAARAQFSPGPLARPHAAIDKPTACLSCHEPRRATTSARCLACHEALAARITAGRGFHATSAARSAACGSCHGDHGGRGLELVSWPGGRDAFDHRLAGFALEGAHSPLACRSCHTASLVRDPAVRAAKSLRLAATYLGLPSRCEDCHGDVHAGQFAAEIRRGDCAACHTLQGWRAVAVDHARTRFPLRGKHAAVACDRCHLPLDPSGTRVASTAPNASIHYRPIAHETCGDCHVDPHRNRYGADCTRCHGVAGWGAIASGAFDHDRTRYPLQGRHRRVACEACHAAGSFKKRLAFARCADCHTDRHTGQLARSESKGACEACHSLEGFAPARYGDPEHARTRFPLRGAHRALACTACHRPTAPDAPRGSARFRLEADACADCHSDPHAGQFARAPGGSDCARCHGETAWRVASFRHDRTAFPLDGGHARAACASCHRVETIGRVRAVRYRPVETACRSCHGVLPPEPRRST